MSQYDLILKYLEDFGSISPMEAFRDLGITKLATRISELSRRGYRFKKSMETRKNRYGQDCRFMRYWRAA